jgi:hypothetical protein
MSLDTALGSLGRSKMRQFYSPAFPAGIGEVLAKKVAHTTPYVQNLSSRQAALDGACHGGEDTLPVPHKQVLYLTGVESNGIREIAFYRFNTRLWANEVDITDPAAAQALRAGLQDDILLLTPADWTLHVVMSLVVARGKTLPPPEWSWL